MNDWEQDPDAWKKDPDWKPGQPEGESHPQRDSEVKRSLEVTIAVKPQVPVFLIEWTEEIPEQISVKNRDHLKLICEIAPLQKALTEEGELFQYSDTRNLWIRIPWEAIA